MITKFPVFPVLSVPDPGFPIGERGPHRGDMDS